MSRGASVGDAGSRLPHLHVDETRVAPPAPAGGARPSPGARPRTGRQAGAPAYKTVYVPAVANRLAQCSESGDLREPPGSGPIARHAAPLSAAAVSIAFASFLPAARTPRPPTDRGRRARHALPAHTAGPVTSVRCPRPALHRWRSGSTGRPICRLSLCRRLYGSNDSRACSLIERLPGV